MLTVLLHDFERNEKWEGDVTVDLLDGQGIQLSPCVVIVTGLPVPRHGYECIFCLFFHPRVSISEQDKGRSSKHKISLPRGMLWCC